ncbi:eCIS core domain-containing protein [Nitrosomonas ureae]|uniref:eCIS core domain-containing protein n=1 Tax=Nitrosomonas ureae TaxID=44577 RepID=A0A1H9D2C7_9PROT|nr:DUF4157 domain-containing protein [Nitrosomonas ureae]SEQ06938.1 protein of unknown function [Nitrosomonas ureae]
MSAAQRLSKSKLKSQMPIQRSVSEPSSSDASAASSGVSGFYSAGPVLSLVPPVQAKYETTSFNDPLQQEPREQESEATAIQTRRMDSQGDDDDNDVELTGEVQQQSQSLQRQVENENEDIIQAEQSSAQTRFSASGSSSIHAIASEGLRGAERSLPGQELIQSSFGRHDISNTRVQVSGPAEQANERLGSRAYTRGDRIAFKEEPDLKLAAHEAAHVVQQRRGVRFKDGIGRPGDKYEQQADAVAERVVANQSTEDLLNDKEGKPQSALQTKCDCGGTCSKCVGERKLESDEATIQMDAEVNASRLSEPVADSSVEASFSSARRNSRIADGAGALAEAGNDQTELNVKGESSPANRSISSVSDTTIDGSSSPSAQTSVNVSGADVGSGSGDGGRSQVEAGISNESDAAITGGSGAATNESGGAILDGSTPSENGDLALIDLELAEHERWAGSFGAMGTAGSDQRARFLLDQARQGAVAGARGGAIMGFAMGAVGAAVGQIAGRRLATMAVSRGLSATPVPGLGAAIGGVMAVAGLAMRDWGQTGETIGRIGTGEGYERLANDLEGIAEVLDVASSIMDVVGGVLGAIAVGMWIGAVLSAGALSPLALTLSAIATGIGLATTAVGIIINVVVRPTVTALRALHAFESQGDPAQIEAEGKQLQAAAGQITGAVAGAAASRLGGAAGSRGGTHLDRGATRLQSRRTGGRPAMSATAGPGPRLHVEVPEAPNRASTDTPGTTPHGEPAGGPPATARPASAEGPAAAAPANVDPRQAEILADIAEHQQLSSGAPSGQPELGNLPGPPGRHLRPGERDSGNFSIPPAARSRAGRQGRSAGMKDLGEAVSSGIDTSRTAAARENLTGDQLLALTDPQIRRSDPEGARDVERSVQASHVPAVAAEPHDSHKGSNVEILPTPAHIEGIHQSDTTRPLGTAAPNPEYKGRPGFHLAPERAPPNPRTDRGLLRSTEQDAAHLEANFPGADPTEIAAARQWLAQRRAELRTSGAKNFPSSQAPAASSPVPHTPVDTSIAPAPHPAYAPHTETARTSDRSAAMAQYHTQVQADPGRESGVWRGADGTYYVMQGDVGTVRPPAAAGPLQLIYHSHPTEADAGARGLVSQPSQAAGDLGVLQYQHGQGSAGQRQASELHFPVYDANGAHSGYGTTRFAYDPTHPLPLQVQTTLPGGRPSTQRYASFADFQQRTGIPAGGATTAESSAARAGADVRLSQDQAVAQQRIDATTQTLLGPRRTVGVREGREMGRQSIENPAHNEGTVAAETLRGPAYTAGIAGLQPGETIEVPINPVYPAPPGTTAELDALMEQMHTARRAEAELAGTEGQMQTQAAQQQADSARLIDAQGVTEDLAAGRTEHQAAADSTLETNTQQQSTAGEAVSSLGRSAQEATALTTLVVSLDAFRGMANLFSYLPGDLGRKAEGASADCSRLIESLNRVHETEGVQAQVTRASSGFEDNAARIEGVATQGQATDESVAEGQAQVIQLQEANAESLIETTATRQQATAERQAAAASETQAQTAHDGLQGELQTWAQDHRQAREDAIAEATNRYRELGYQVREGNEHDRP